MEKNHKTNHSEHGAGRSYVIGYILSLIFTFIPFFMVVNKWLTGNGLVITILSIGVLQMAIQLLFFLHLGRGPKPLYNVVFFFATAGVIVVTIGASLFIMDNLYRNMSASEMTQRIAQDEAIAQVGGNITGACEANKDSHVVAINDRGTSPSFVIAERCDTITFVNDTDDYLDIRFGSKDEEVSYGGLYEITVRPGRPETVTLNQEGEFTYYDYFNTDVIGRFKVSE